jgi:predicted site-specific integrase-resolvase
MLSPGSAMRILDVRMGITVGRSTFYRWMQTGRLFSIKLGGKIYVPLSEMETIMERLSRGERL